MERAEDHICPRCGGDVPTTEFKGQYPGAVSRVAAVEICSACGTDEALMQFLDGSTHPREAWPVERTYTLPDLRDLELQPEEDVPIQTWRRREEE